MPGQFRAWEALPRAGGGAEAACTAPVAGSILISFAVTSCPGLTFWPPSAMTRSPSATPEVTSQSLPMLRDTTRRRACALPSAPTTSAMASPCASRVTARCGTRKLSGETPSSMVALTYMPGHSSRSGLGNCTLTAKVPVSSLTFASAKANVPSCG